MRAISTVILLYALTSPTVAYSDNYERLLGRNNYDQVKEAVIKRWIADDRLTNYTFEEPFELSPCYSIADDWGVSDSVYDLVTIASLAISWADTYQQAGYPESAYRSAIRRAENMLLDRSERGPLLDGDDYVVFVDEQQDQVVAAAKEWRAQHDRKLPTVDSGGECGAGGPVEVSFRSEPTGGDIFLISEFEYELCISRDTNPNNREECRFWRHATQNRAWVSGWMYVQGEWPQGKSNPKKEDFENVEPGDEITVELR